MTEYIKLRELIQYQFFGFTNARENDVIGEYPLFFIKPSNICRIGIYGARKIYNNLIFDIKYIDKYDFNDESILIKYNEGKTEYEVYYYNGKFSVESGINRFKSKDERFLTKYLYYCLKNEKNNRNNCLEINILNLSINDQLEIIKEFEEKEKIIDTKEKNIERLQNEIKNIKSKVYDISEILINKKKRRLSFDEEI
jgi:hypothetical protein